jgi:hypothetical protein
MRGGRAAYRRVGGLTAVVLVALSTMSPGPHAHAALIVPEYRYDQVASDDATLSSSAPSASSGTGETLQTAAGVRTYVRIEVTQSARELTLRLFALADGPGSLVYVTSGEWNEAQLSATNAPPPGQFVGKIGPVRKGQWVSVDATGALCRSRLLMGCRPGVYAFVLTASTGKTTYASTEHWLQAGPRLVVRVA